MLCELHIPSNCSDSSFGPEEPVGIAREAGRKAAVLAIGFSAAGVAVAGVAIAYGDALCPGIATDLRASQ